MPDPYEVYKAKVMTNLWEELALGGENIYDQDHPYGRKWARNWAAYRGVIDRINTAAKNNNIVFDRAVKPFLISTLYRIVKESRKKAVTQNEIDIIKDLAVKYCVDMGNSEDNCRKFVDDVIGVTVTTTTTTTTTTQTRRRR